MLSAARHVKHLIVACIVVSGRRYQQRPALTCKVCDIPPKLEERPLFKRSKVSVSAAPAEANDIGPIHRSVNDPLDPKAYEAITGARSVDRQELGIPAGAADSEAVVRHSDGHTCDGSAVCPV